MFKLFLKKIKNKIIFILEKNKWEKNNKHNYTKMNCYFPCEIVSVGNYSYGNLNVHYYKTSLEKLKIGNFCSIADNVHFFLAGGHRYDTLLTFPLKNYLSKNKIKESTSKGPIIVEDDVWIGYGCTILSGVTIGKGAIIGANSVVTKNVPPYSIFVGNKVVKKRFEDDIIDKLSKVNLKKLSFDKCQKNLDLFYKKIETNNVDEVIEEINKIMEE